MLWQLHKFFQFPLQEKDDVQAQKSETQNKLSEAEARANSLEEQKGAIMGQISSSEQELVDVLSQIDILAGEITDKEAEIEKQKKILYRQSRKETNSTKQ